MNPQFAQDELDAAFETLAARSPQDDAIRRRAVWKGIEARRRRWKKSTLTILALAAAAGVAFAAISLRTPKPRTPAVVAVETTAPIEAIEPVEATAIVAELGRIDVTDDRITALTDAEIEIDGHRLVMRALTSIERTDEGHLTLRLGEIALQTSSSILVSTPHADIELFDGDGRVLVEFDRSLVEVISGRASVRPQPDFVALEEVPAGALTTVEARPKRVERPRPKIDVRAIVARADELRRTGAIEEAIDLYERAAGLPTSEALREEVLLRTAELYLELGRPAMARRALVDARKRISKPLLEPERRALEARLDEEDTSTRPADAVSGD